MVSSRVFADSNLDPRFRAGLVGHWIGGGSGRTWFDRSGYGNHGTLVGGPLWTLGPDGTPALSFDGIDDYVSVPASALFTFGTGDFAVSLWLNSTTSFKDVVNTTSSTSWGLASNGGDLYWQSQYGVTNLYFRPCTSIQDGRWHRVTVTRSATESTMWFDRDQQGAGVTDATNYTASGALKVMGNLYPFAAGGMFDLRVYRRALSAAEIATLASPSYSPIIGGGLICGL